MVDNASAHTTEKLKGGENIMFIFLPANAPEPDREVLERVERLALRLRAKNIRRSKRVNQSRTRKFLGKGNEFDNII